LPIHDLDAIHTSPINDGWLAVARIIPSPNCNDRPDPDDISLLVIHNISLPPAQFGGGYIEHFFCNTLDCSVHPYFQEIESLQVSSHFLITREGELLQFVPLQQRAWHAGQSCFDGREHCNDFSLGIELEGTDTLAYTANQYRVLAVLTQRLLAAFPAINQQRIVGHSDIAPGRKTDPGPAFDWQHFQQLTFNV
jgi:AmpD protein